MQKYQTFYDENQEPIKRIAAVSVADFREAHRRGRSFQCTNLGKVCLTIIIALCVIYPTGYFIYRTKRMKKLMYPDEIVNVQDGPIDPEVIMRNKLLNVMAELDKQMNEVPRRPQLRGPNMFMDPLTPEDPFYNL